MFAEIGTYFTDAVLRAPTIGSMLMCLAASQVGVIAFLRKQSLLGEALSHAAYPGVILGVIGAALVGVDIHQDFSVPILIMTGAFLTAVLGLWAINLLTRTLKIRPDSALCFTLSAFFGIGLTLASQVQFTHTILYKQSLSYIYGQAATMTDTHIFLYGGLSLMIIAAVMLFYKELQVMIFDLEYAKSLGINTKLVDAIVFILIVLAVVVGMRSVGVVLMSAMFIAPAAAARQFTNKLSLMLIIAGCVGVLSGFFGNYLSVEVSHQLMKLYPEDRLALPTGPMIVIVASLICVLSLLFAPERGLVLRYLRVAYFHYKCACENLLKAIWRYGAEKPQTLEAISRHQGANVFYTWLVLKNLLRSGWMKKNEKGLFLLTNEGRVRAEHVVRLHRLWEVYLVEYLGVGAERVHRNAEQMEHIITPELEIELSQLLHDPKEDPHQQPIPPAVTGRSDRELF